MYSNKLIKDNYLPGKVLEKINTHSYSGFVQCAQNYIISEYESMCCIQNCYILLHMLGKQRVAVTLAMQSCYWVASEEVANVAYTFEFTRNETFN